MAVTYTLTGEPTPVTEAGYPNGALIYNTGAATAYASEDPGGQVTGFPVPASGGSLTWDVGRPLYLSAAPGQTTTVTVDDNSSSTVNSPADIASALIGSGLAQDIANDIATSPLAANVANNIVASSLTADIAGDIITVQKAGATLGQTIATDLTTSGLSSAIATDIVSSGLSAAIANDISGSNLSSVIAADIVASALTNNIASDILTVQQSGATLAQAVAADLTASGLSAAIAQQIQSVGVPPIDAPALLFTKTAALGPSGSWLLSADTSTWIDISRYQSLYVHVVANAKGTTGLNDTFVSSVYMMPSTSAPFGSALALETCECALTNVGATDANGSWSHMTVPAQGAGLALGLQVFTSTGAGSYNTNYTITVYGSYRSVTDLKIIAQNQSLISSLDSPTLPGMDSMHYSMNVTIPASTGQSFSLSYINAPFQFSYTLLSGAVTTGSDIYISSATPNRQYAGMYADKTGTFNIQRWEGLFTGGSMPRLWINNKDAVAKNYNLYFAFQR